MEEEKEEGKYRVCQEEERKLSEPVKRNINSREEFLKNLPEPFIKKDSLAGGGDSRDIPPYSFIQGLLPTRKEDSDFPPLPPIQGTYTY